MEIMLCRLVRTTFILLDRSTFRVSKNRSKSIACSTIGEDDGIMEVPVFMGDNPPDKLPNDPTSDPMAKRCLRSSITAMELSRIKNVNMIKNNEHVITTPISAPDDSSLFFTGKSIVGPQWRLESGYHHHPSTGPDDPPFAIWDCISIH